MCFCANVWKVGVPCHLSLATTYKLKQFLSSCAALLSKLDIFHRSHTLNKLAEFIRLSRPSSKFKIFGQFCRALRGFSEDVSVLVNIYSFWTIMPWSSWILTDVSVLGAGTIFSWRSKSGPINHREENEKVKGRHTQTQTRTAHSLLQKPKKLVWLSRMSTSLQPARPIRGWGKI